MARVTAWAVRMHTWGAQAVTFLGPVSATIVVNLRSEAACLRNASTVLEIPIVRIISLVISPLEQVGPEEVTPTLNGCDHESSLLRSHKLSPTHPPPLGLHQ